MIYVANGFKGGTIVSQHANGQSPLSINGRDFRFSPEGILSESITGMGQYGVCFDDFGNRFVVSNRNPFVHVVFEDRVLSKSDKYLPPAVTHDVVTPGEKSTLHPITKTWTTSILHQGQFTAACGLQLIRGEGLPEKYRGMALTCDPTGNLVHAESIRDVGVTFQGTPFAEDREFLASMDPWFRPVNLENGPDGALYVVDMYRAVIEHPDWVPEELKKRPDERFGDDRGRIWRIRSKGAGKQSFSKLPPRSELGSWIPLLENGNSWTRETAQRILIESGDRSIVPAVEKFENQTKSIQGKIQATWTLVGLGAVSKPWLMERIRSGIDELATKGDMTEQRVIFLNRWLEQFVRLSLELGVGWETWSALSKVRMDRIHPRLGSRVLLDMAPDQVDDDFATLLTKVLPGLMAEPGLACNLDAALLIACREPKSAIQSIISSAVRSDDPRWRTRQFPIVVKKLAELAANSADRDGTFQFLTDLARSLPHDTTLQNNSNDLSEIALQATLTGVGESLQKRGEKLSDGLASLTDAGVRNLIKKALQHYRDVAGDEGASDNARVAAIAVIATTGSAEVFLADLVRNDPNLEVKRAAVQGLARFAKPEVYRELLTLAKDQTPTLSRQIVEGALSKASSVEILLQLIQDDLFPASTLDQTQLDRLLNHREEKVRSLAQKLLRVPPSADRLEVIDRYEKALEENPDPKRGIKVFEKSCATCHRLGGNGVDVAPNIGDLRTKSFKQILLDVLEPNRAIDGNYVAYALTTTDGRSFTGIVSSETASAITLKQPGGMVLTFPRSEIEELRATGKSLMPEGLDRQVSPEDMADVISFVKNWRYLDGSAPATAIK